MILKISQSQYGDFSYTWRFWETHRHIQNMISDRLWNNQQIFEFLQKRHFQKVVWRAFSIFLCSNDTSRHMPRYLKLSSCLRQKWKQNKFHTSFFSCQVGDSSGCLLPRPTAARIVLPQDFLSEHEAGLHFITLRIILLASWPLISYYFSSLQSKPLRVTSFRTAPVPPIVRRTNCAKGNAGAGLLSASRWSYSALLAITRQNFKEKLCESIASLVRKPNTESIWDEIAAFETNLKNPILL